MLYPLARRQVLGYGMASLAFARAALAEDPSGFQPLPDKIEVTPSHLTTAVRINGHGPFRFIVDTGADRSVISQEVADALHLKPGRTMVVQGIIRAIEAKSVPIAHLKFGSVERDNLEMPVLPRKLLQADGFLGLDAIGHHRVVFDFEKKTLRVVEPIPAEFVERSGSSDTRIAAPGDDSHLRSAECRVDGVSTVAFIDTGAEISAGNEALRQALMNLNPGYAGVRDIELTGITGGSRTGRVLKVETILFGTLEFSGCEIAVADLDVFKIWNLQEKPALLIGLNFLKEFRMVSVDFRRKEYRLRLAQAVTPWVKRA